VRTLILLVAIVLIFYIARYLWQKKGLSGKQISGKFLLYGLAAALVLLMLTGRVPWIMGVLGAALPLIARFLPLIRYIPLLRSLYRRFQDNQSTASSNGSRQTSSVQSRYLRMLLNHTTGEMDGEILAGSLQGRKLNELPVERLVDLLAEFSDDEDSLALLQTYLDRVHSDWREQAGASYAGAESNNNLGTSGQMSVQEAYEILGIESQATHDQIIAAHRRLMQKLHPDRGGSSYLAAKINKAKDVLLKNAKR
jgi:hypothetical protein